MKAEWEELKLGDIIKLEYGKPLPITRRKKDGQFPVYGANGEIDRTDDFYFDKASFIVGRKGSAGEITFTEEKFWPLDVTYFCTFDEKKYDLKFLYSLLLSLNLPRLAKGVKPGINRNEVYAIDVKVPSLAEQQRIVALLDQALAAIDTAKANTEKNLKNAQELFEKIWQSFFPESGVLSVDAKSLHDLCEMIVDCEHKTAPKQEFGIASIRTPNIGKGELLLDGVNRVSEETYLNWTRRARPIAGDLVLAREAPAGNVAVIPEGLTVCLGQRTVLIRPKKEIYVSEYLAFFLLSKASQRKLLSYARGATVEHVNVKDIREFKINDIPSKNDQQLIIDKIKEVSRQEKQLSAFYQQKFRNLEELRKSILQKAFSGEL